MSTPPFRALVLAGERAGGSRLARALGLPAAVLAPLAGRPCILRVIDALCAARQVQGVTLCGPRPAVIDASPDLTALLRREDVAWLAPAAGPAASASAAAQAGGRWPLLLTSGDHGLLTPGVVDTFCADARAAADAGGADVIVGLVPHRQVARAFPDSRRTVLRFADGAYCGSNLFALVGPGSLRALAFWSSVEADRKRPWRIARRLGAATLLRYLLGRLPVDGAFDVLSRRAGCRVRWIPVACARAAVDVDSEADWRLADRLLTADAGAEPGCRT